VELSSDWIRNQITSGALSTIPSSSSNTIHSYADVRVGLEVAETEPIKTLVSPDDYEEVKVADGKTFFLDKQLSKHERAEYLTLLVEFDDVFAWLPSDLVGIPPKLGEHHIDLMEGARSVRQRQYRLNPKYSMMVKEELDKLLKAGFIYPVTTRNGFPPL